MGAGVSSDRVHQVEDRFVKSAMQRKKEKAMFLQDPLMTIALTQQVEDCLSHVRSLKKNIAGGTAPTDASVKEHLVSIRKVFRSEIKNSIGNFVTLGVNDQPAQQPKSVRIERDVGIQPQIEKVPGRKEQVKAALEKSFEPSIEEDVVPSRSADSSSMVENSAADSGKSSIEIVKGSNAEMFKLQSPDAESFEVAHTEQSKTSLKGISLANLKSFSQEKNDIIQDKSTRWVCEEIIKPATSASKCSYVQLLRSSGQSVEFKDANVFVSHAWDCSFEDLVDSIVAWAEDTRKSHQECMLWIDIFCIDQNKRSEFGSDAALDLESPLKIAIVTLFIISPPWFCFKRLWCLYEVVLSNSCRCERVFLIPPPKRREFIESLKSNGQFWDLMGEVDGSTAECSDKDVERKLKLHISSTIQFPTFNNIVMNEIKAWFLPFALQIYESLEPSSRWKGAFHSKLTKLLRHSGKIESALAIENDSLVAKVAEYGNDHKDVLETRENIALLYGDAGQFETALEILEDVLNTNSADEPTSDADSARILKHIGFLLDSQGRYHEALDKYKRSLDIDRSICGSSHVGIANTLNNMGLVYDKLTCFYDALRVYEEALDIYRRALGHSHVSVADAINNIANVYEQLGRLDDALSRHRQALDIRCANLGTNHASVADTENNIASVLMNMGQARRGEAILHLGRALGIYASTYTGDSNTAHNLRVATTLMNMGAAQREQGQTSQALTNYSRALEMQRAALGECHADVALTMEHVAYLLRGAGDRRRAREYYCEAHVIYMERLGPAHPSTRRVLRALAVDE